MNITQAPQGHASSTPPPMGGPSTGVALPGATPTTLPTPDLPGSGPEVATSKAPANWADPVRIMRDILELWESSPKEAVRVQAFAKERLAAINAGK